MRKTDLSGCIVFRLPQPLLNCTVLACLLIAVSGNSAVADDEPAGAQTASTTPISKLELKFGEKQLKRMLSDRKSMRQLVTKGDDLWLWSAQQFAGNGGERRYKWKNKTSKKSGVQQFGAFHNYDLNKNTGWICVQKTRSDGLAAAPEQMWSGVIYEFFNSRNDKDFEETWKLAAHGKLTKEEYLARATKLEYNALKEMNSFYENTWKLHAEKMGYPSWNAYWYKELPATYEEWIDQYKKINPAYVSYHEKSYEVATSKLKPTNAISNGTSAATSANASTSGAESASATESSADEDLTAITPKALTPKANPSAK